MAFMVATTTSIHKETGANNFITCCAPYFNPSSSPSLNKSLFAGICGWFGGRTEEPSPASVIFLSAVASGLTASVACVYCDLYIM